jgi:carbamoyl-phosphate synthase large subunit
MAKAQIAAGLDLPRSGRVLLTVNDNDKGNVVGLARELLEMGFQLVATHRTAAFLQREGLAITPIFKVHEGRPDIVDWIKDGKIQLVINTPLGRRSYFDELAIRRAAVQYSVPCITTLSGAVAAVAGIRALQNEVPSIRSLQQMHQAIHDNR